MPALAATPALGKSTNTSPMRVCASTVGATMRTLPGVVCPPGSVTRTGMPTVMRASSRDVTSARHSRRPLRIMRNSSAPLPTTAPTVAVRAEITPSSGASTCAKPRRSCWLPSVLFNASTRAWAVFSSVTYWLIWLALSAPVVCRLRARSALAAASAAVAWASSKLARAWATSACGAAGEKRASSWPLRTTSPTLARTSVSRRPVASAPTTASCHAATLPLAARLTGSAVGLGWVVDTVRAGLAAGLGASAARLSVRHKPIVQTMTALVAMNRSARRRFSGLQAAPGEGRKKVVMAWWRGRWRCGWGPRCCWHGHWQSASSRHPPRGTGPPRRCSALFAA